MLDEKTYGVDLHFSNQGIAEPLLPESVAEEILRDPRAYLKKIAERLKQRQKNRKK